MRNQSVLLGVVACMVVVTMVGCSSVSKAPSPPAGSQSNQSAQPAASIELKVGTKMTADSPEGRAFQRFADLANERSNGRLHVTVYPSEQLGAGTVQLDNVVLGSQDMYAEGSTYLAGFNKDYNISSIPFLFRDADHYRKFCTGPLSEEMHKTLIAKGIRILNTKRNFVRGPYRVLVSTKPVKSLADVRGMKIRSFESPVYGACWAHLGANPIVIAYTETYLALKQNVVQGGVLPISNLYSMKWTEVGKYVARLDEFPQDVVIVINNKKFESLPADLQNVLTDAANDAGDYATELANKSAEEDTKKIEQEHKAIFTKIDTTEWREKMKPFFAQIEEKGLVSKGMIEKVLAIK